MRCTDQILIVAAEYGRAADIEPKTVSWRVFGDTKKLGAIAEGGDLSTGRFESAMRWFSENWPAGVDWPGDVVRPREAGATLSGGADAVTRNPQPEFRS